MASATRYRIIEHSNYITCQMVRHEGSGSLKKLGALVACLGLALLVWPSVAAHADGLVNWTGNGTDAKPCTDRPDNSLSHWIFTTGGGSTVTAAVLTVDGTDYTMSQSGSGSWSADVPGGVPTSASVTYTGDLGTGQAVVTISCLGTNSSPTTPPPTTPPPTTPPPTTPPPTTPPPTTPPPTTPPPTTPPPTTAPPPTTPPPTSPPPTVGGKTVHHHHRCEGHGKNRPRCQPTVLGTTVAPKGLAFTGSDVTMRFGGLAVLLFGLALLLIGASRNYEREQT
jgi:hypothetical protein